MIREHQLTNVQYGSRTYKKFAVRYPYLKDDLYSEMLFAVNHANKKLSQEGANKDNVPAYVCQTVKGYLANMVAKNSPFGVSRMTYKRLGYKTVERSYRKINVADPRAGHTVELKELIASCYDCSRTKQIIELSVAGYKNKEIGSMLNLTAARVQQIIHDFRSKLLCSMLQSGDKNLMQLAKQNLRKGTSLQEETDKKLN